MDNKLLLTENCLCCTLFYYQFKTYKFEHFYINSISNTYLDCILCIFYLKKRTFKNNNKKLEFCQTNNDALIIIINNN